MLGNLTLNLDSYRVYVAGEEVELTFHELDLLRILCANPGRIVSYSALATEILGKTGKLANRHLNVLIHRLRAKLVDSQPYVIDTVRGRGYGLLPLGEPAQSGVKAIHPDARAGPAA